MDYDFIAGDTGTPLLLTFVDKVTRLRVDLSADGTTAQASYSIVDYDNSNIVIVPLTVIDLEIQSPATDGDALYNWPDDTSLKSGTGCSQTGVLIGQAWATIGGLVSTGLYEFQALIGPKKTV